MVIFLFVDIAFSPVGEWVELEFFLNQLFEPKCAKEASVEALYLGHQKNRSFLPLSLIAKGYGQSRGIQLIKIKEKRHARVQN